MLQVLKAGPGAGEPRGSAARQEPAAGMLQRVSSLHQSLESTELFLGQGCYREALRDCQVQRVSQLEVRSSSWEQPHSILWGLTGSLALLHLKAPCVRFNEVHTFQVSRPSEGFHSVLHSAALHGRSPRLSKVRG